MAKPRKATTTATSVGVVNAVTSYLELLVSGKRGAAEVKMDLGDSAPSTVYATKEQQVVIVEGGDLPDRVHVAAAGKQLRHAGTIECTGTIALMAYRSVELKLPPGHYDVFTDHTPIELAGGARSTIVARLAPAGVLTARPAAKPPAPRPPLAPAGTDLASLIGDRRPASVVNLALRDIHALPDLSPLVKLRDLNLATCPIAELPPSLWKLPKLEKLDLYGVPITMLPEAIGGLEKLKHLRLDHTRVSRLPEALWTLDLTELRMTGLPITELPAGIGRLARLTLLWIDGTQLTTLPAEVATLRKLQRLRVSKGIAGLDAFRAARPNCLVQTM